MHGANESCHQPSNDELLNLNLAKIILRTTIDLKRYDSISCGMHGLADTGSAGEQFDEDTLGPHH